MWFDLFLFSSRNSDFVRFNVTCSAFRCVVVFVLHGCPAVKVSQVSEGMTTTMTTAICGETTCSNNVREKKKKNHARNTLVLVLKLGNTHTHTKKKSSSYLQLAAILHFFLYSFFPMFPPTNEGLSVTFKALGHTFNIPRRKYICKDSFNLTTCSHLRWSLPASLAANLPPALCPSVHRLLRPDLCGLTSGAPGSPLAGPTLAPGGSSTQRRASVTTPDKRPM